MSHDHWPHEQPQETQEPKKTFWTLRTQVQSDEAFIEQIRKSADWSKRWWWLQVLPLAVIVVMGWEVQKFAQGPGPIGQARFGWDELRFWASLAGIFCFGAGFKIGHVFMSTAETFWGDRRTDLLLRYHDLLNEHNILPKPQTIDTP